jgi:hypothetical protein
MASKRCASVNQNKLCANIYAHFTGWKRLDKPAVSIFPKLLVRLHSGFTEFPFPKAICDSSLKALLLRHWFQAEDDHS